MDTEENGRRGLQPETPLNTEIESMSKQQAITLVHVECDSPREYRAIRNICAGYPHRAELRYDGRIAVHDSQWFARLLASCSGRVIDERCEVVPCAPSNAVRAEVV